MNHWWNLQTELSPWDYLQFSKLTVVRWSASSKRLSCISLFLYKFIPKFAPFSCHFYDMHTKWEPQNRTIFKYFTFNMDLVSEPRRNDNQVLANNKYPHQINETVKKCLASWNVKTFCDYLFAVTLLQSCILLILL